MYSNHSSSSSSSPSSSAVCFPPAVPSNFFPAGRSYSLWDFTLTSPNPRCASYTKSNFPIHELSSQKDNRLLCHFSNLPPIQEINSRTGKKQQFAAGAPAPRRPLRSHSAISDAEGDEVSCFFSFPSLVITPPQANQTQDEGSSGFNIVFGWTVLTKKQIKSSTIEMQARLWVIEYESPSEDHRVKSRFYSLNWIVLFMSDTRCI